MNNDCISNDCISIIIPVYNGEKFIENAIKSCVNQSYSSLEIIVVNDGSIDNTWSILEMFSKSDNRIKTLNVRNSGAPAARNRGLNIATGKYILFLDADDTLETDACKELISIANREDTIDFVIFGFNVFEGKRLLRTPNPGNFIFNYEDDFPRFESIRRLMASPCNKFYRKDYIQYRFNEKMSFAEDIVFNYENLHCESKIIAVNRCLYNVQLGTENSVNKRYRIGKIKDFIYSCEVEEKKLRRLFENTFNKGAYYKIISSSFCVVVETCAIHLNKDEINMELDKVRKNKTYLNIINCDNKIRMIDAIVLHLLKKERFRLLKSYCKLLLFARDKRMR